MFADIVFPRDNESKFIKVAGLLSLTGLCLAYEFRSRQSLEDKKDLVKRLQAKTGLRLFLGCVAKPNEIKEARKTADLVLVKSCADNRKTFERTDIDGIFELEDEKRGDSMHFRRSGLNQVLCKIAEENRVLVCFSISMILMEEGWKRARILGRIRQNIRLCRKYRVQTVFASFANTPEEMRSHNDLRSLGTILGMRQGDINSSLNNISHRIDENRKYRAGSFIAEGIIVEDDESVKK